MRHKFVSAKSDGGDATLVRPSDWNAEHLPENGDTKPDSPGTYDEEFEGTADTLPTNWSWISTPSTWKLNSTWKSWLMIEHPASTSETKELRRASFTPGAGNAFGLWFAVTFGNGRWNNNGSSFSCMILDSSEAEGFGVLMQLTSVFNITSRQKTTGTEANVLNGNASNMDVGPQKHYVGITRTTGNIWSLWHSYNGIAFQQYWANTSKTFTVDRIQFKSTSNGDQGVERAMIDFIRYKPNVDIWTPR